MPPPALSLDTGSTPLANQVAGHQNVLSDSSGSLVIKPSLPREIAFYHLLNSASRSSQLAKLKPFVPQFYGTLRLEGKLDTTGELTQDGLPVEAVPESVVLENLAHAYTRPCVLDVKLGTVLYSPDAPPEKKARMEKAAKSSTSYETGIRLTGCQTWHAPTSSYILTPKSYGKTITVEELPTGLTRFFPLPTDRITALLLPPTPPPSSTATSPNTGMIAPHLPLPPSTVVQAPLPSTPISGLLSPEGPQEYTSHAISPDTLLRVLELVDGELAKLQSVLEHLEARFIGSSVLLVYEGDPDRLEDALDRWEEKIAREKLLAAEAATRGDISEEEDDDDDESDEEEEGSSTSSDDDEDDGARADIRRARRCPPLTLRMIDFAHTSLVEGEGADEGVLKGLRTLRGLVQGRIQTVREVTVAERRGKVKATGSLV